MIEYQTERKEEKKKYSAKITRVMYYICITKVVDLPSTNQLRVASLILRGMRKVTSGGPPFCSS